MLAQAAAGGSGTDCFGSAGANGAAGSVNVTGGVFNFTAGQITADTSITPATPAALVKATMNVSGGAVNLLNNFTNHLGTLNLTSTGVINGNGANGAPAGSLDRPAQDRRPVDHHVGHVWPSPAPVPRSICSAAPVVVVPFRFRGWRRRWGGWDLERHGRNDDAFRLFCRQPPGGNGGLRDRRGGLGGAGRLQRRGGTTTLSLLFRRHLEGGGRPPWPVPAGWVGGTLNVTGGTTTLATHLS